MATSRQSQCAVLPADDPATVLATIASPPQTNPAGLHDPFDTPSDHVSDLSQPTHEIDVSSLDALTDDITSTRATLEADHSTQPSDGLPANEITAPPSETPLLDRGADQRPTDVSTDDVADGSGLVDPFDDSQFDLTATGASDQIGGSEGDGLGDIADDETLDEPSDGSGWADD